MSITQEQWREIAPTHEDRVRLIHEFEAAGLKMDPKSKWLNYVPQFLGQVDEAKVLEIATGPKKGKKRGK